MGAPLRPVPYPVSFLDLPWAIFVEGAKVLKHVELSLNLLWPPSCVCPPSCCKTFKTDSKRTPRVGVSSGSLRYTPRTINQGPRPDHGVTVSTVTPRVAAALVVVWGACLGPASTAAARVGTCTKSRKRQRQRQGYPHMTHECSISLKYRQNTLESSFCPYNSEMLQDFLNPHVEFLNS